MKLLICPLLLIFLWTSNYGQTATKPNCQLQELAINAALGDVESQYNLGVEFFRGENVPQDYGKAAAMWRLASNGGMVMAFNNLGYLTYYGKGVKQDYKEGVRLWRVAAEKGLSESQVHLAHAYSDGKFLEIDFVEAYAWAKAGRHFASKEENAQLGKSIMEMAEKVLIEVRNNLSNAQLENAEKKAAEYIAKFAPK